jgi:hypothetical protein
MQKARRQYPSEGTSRSSAHGVIGLAEASSVGHRDPWFCQPAEGREVPSAMHAVKSRALECGYKGAGFRFAPLDGRSNR